MSSKKKKTEIKKDKTKDIIIIILMLIIIILTIFGIINTWGKINVKEKITDKKFVKVVENLKFDTKDIKEEQGKERGKMLKSVTSATKGDLTIDFYIFKTEKIAKGAFFSGEELFSDVKNISYKKNVERGKNYSRFLVNKDSRYGIVSRIDNTLILVDTTKNNKNEVEKVMKEIGY